MRLRYREVETSANRLANILREKGVDRGARVGVCAERSVDAVIAMFAVMKAGGAYVAIDPDHPAPRIANMLRLAGATLLICARNWFEKKTIDGVAPLFSDALRSAGSVETIEAPQLRLESSDLAYVVFTSGSTGEPKGVAVTHLALANYVAAIGARLGERGLNFALASTLAADLGYTAIFPCFASGGRLHVFTDDEVTEAGAFSAAVSHNDIDVLKIGPSHFGALSMDDVEGASIPQKALIFGGEALPASFIRDVARKAMAAGPRTDGLRIFNHYGPTETTIGGLMTQIEPQDLVGAAVESLPIGRPLENFRVYTLSPDLTVAPQGAPGEISIGGAGVARGYVDRPDLTAERFVPDPNGPPGARLYRTGDLGVFGDNGALRFLGRIDAQVKIRGFRVEPGEVEARLREHAGVRQAAVSPYMAPNSRTQLAAYIVAKEGVSVSAQDLYAFLRRSLPEHMVPSAVVFLDALPLTKNGKVDRKRLPLPDADQQTQSLYRAPKGEIETRLAAIFADLLGVERIGADDNFFAGET